ncbi:hypothetical protein FLJC2902T_12670 [Flavobacterium limnosediminis JC2902]|uniref:Lysine-specific metallo-endopeptidase domain-containing protein n=1 Tax=Flavobacterium limnosediminis JC2902 TaxID=1341181 RepID=V6SPZ1_9FLAO|nr:hypothetical protein [Flavobacterium limnosediminis]ESU28676.1 hypothetical protein FLJC2902T_12670 [Flavobacterium limnosediminis JC2902]
MNRFYYKGTNEKLIRCLAIAERILNGALFYSKIESVESFSGTSVSSSKIASDLKSFRETVTVEGYWNIFGLANAKTGSSELIKINTAKLRRSEGSIVNTIIHEYVHAVDYKDGILDYTHSDNINRGEENKTAPWLIGKIAEDMM